MKRTVVVAALAGSALGLAAAALEEARAQDGAARVEVAAKEPYGEYLVDAEGKSLYIFLADSPDNSNCYDQCAEAWPPLLSAGEPVAGEGVDKAMIGAIERAGQGGDASEQEAGAQQVTYNGWPLYYYVQDQQPGDTKGQDIEGFGAEWYLIGPSGEKVEAEGEEHTEEGTKS